MTNTFSKWFAGAYFQNEGRPITWYHGTSEMSPFNAFTTTDAQSIGFHFGTLQTAINFVQMCEFDEFRIVEAYCAAKKPIRLPDLSTWSPRDVVANIKISLSDSGTLDDRSAHILHTLDDIIESNTVDHLTAIYAALEMLGYDSIIYRNDVESTYKHSVDSIIVWDTSLIKSPNSPEFIIGDPKFDSSKPITARDLNIYEVLTEDIEELKLSNFSYENTSKLTIR